MNATLDNFDGFFWDGRTAQMQPMQLRAADAGLALQGPDGARLLPAQDVLPIHPSRSGVQFLRLKSGETCELPASDALLSMLKQAGIAFDRESALSALLSGNMRAAALALAFLAGTIAAFYVWLLPTAAEIGAATVPAQVQRSIGENALEHMAGVLKPSKLPRDQQAAIQTRFEAMTEDLDGPESKGMELLIRQMDGPPNAFALPGNYIVLSDELVAVVDGDLDAVAGVLAHEIGHLHHNHAMRSVVQASALTMLGTALIGDYSSALAILPATLGHLHYSRRFEAEADQYARNLLCAQSIDPAKTAVFFDRMEKRKDNPEGIFPSYLNSHPPSAERAALFRQPC